jgi:hypothetical protein
MQSRSWWHLHVDRKSLRWFASATDREPPNHVGSAALDLPPIGPLANVRPGSLMGDPVGRQSPLMRSSSVGITVGVPVEGSPSQDVLCVLLSRDITHLSYGVY